MRKEYDQIFLAEAEGDVGYFSEHILNFDSRITLVCLSNTAAAEAEMSGAVFVSAEELLNSNEFQSLKNWENDSKLASQIVSGFGRHTDAADVGWWSIFMMVRVHHRLILLAKMFGRLSAKLHMLIPRYLYLNRAFTSRLESSGVIPIYLDLVAKSYGLKVVFWTCDTPKTRGLLRRRWQLVKTVLSVLVASWRVFITLSKSQQVDVFERYDVVLDGWGDELERYFDLEKTVKEISDLGLSAVHIYYDFGHWSKEYSRSTIEQAGQVFVNGFHWQPTAIKGRYWGKFFQIDVLKKCQSAVRDLLKVHPVPGLLWKWALSVRMWAIIIDGMYQLQCANSFIAQFPHRRYVGVAGDNRIGRARMIASRNINARQGCISHGFNFYREPPPMYMHDLVLTLSEEKRETLKQSGMPADRVCVVRREKPVDLFGNKEYLQKFPVAPYKILVILSSTHLEYTDYSVQAFKFLNQTIEELFLHLGSEIQITYKIHYSTAGKDERIVKRLMERWSKYDLEIVHDSWGYQHWNEYHLGFSLETISTSMVLCMMQQVPFIYFSRVLKEENHFCNLDKITVKVTDPAFMAEYIRRVLYDTQWYAHWQAKGLETAQIYTGQIFGESGFEQSHFGIKTIIEVLR